MAPVFEQTNAKGIRKHKSVGWGCYKSQFSWWRQRRWGL
jgi:hypothetical protein